MALILCVYIVLGCFLDQLAILVLTIPVVIGAVAGWAYNRRVASRPDGEAAQRLAVLVVSGLIVGESLFNVALAGSLATCQSTSQAVREFRKGR